MLAFVNEQEPFWIWPATFGAIAAIVLLFRALNRLDRRRHPGRRRAFSAGGNALMRVEAIFLPGREHVIEAMERKEEQEDESGDPPETGS